MSRKLKGITIALPDIYTEALDQLVKYNLFLNRSVALRYIICSFVKKEFKPTPKEVK